MHATVRRVKMDLMLQLNLVERLLTLQPFRRVAKRAMAIKVRQTPLCSAFCLRVSNLKKKEAGASASSVTMDPVSKEQAGPKRLQWLACLLGHGVGGTVFRTISAVLCDRCQLPKGPVAGSVPCLPVAKG